MTTERQDILSEYVIDPVTGIRYVRSAVSSIDADGNVITDSAGNPAGNAVISKNINEIFTPVTPTIYTNSGATSSTGSSVVINSGAAAGSRHVEDSSPTEAEALIELVGFEFDLADQIKFATLHLSVVGLGASEVQALKFVTNGDAIGDATLLNNEDDVSWVLRNETVEITSGSTNYLTRIGCIATNSAVATAVATGAKIFCMGYK